MPRYLGIDYGLKRIGLAVSDARGRIATPVGQLPGTGRPAADAARLREVVEDYGVEAIVIGLPLMEDGSEGEQAKRSRAFGEAVAELLDLTVHYADERYSSATANDLLDQRPELTRQKRKARKDALAAHTILQSFLHQSRESTDDG